MSDRPSLEDLLAVQGHFGLPSLALVEKDWHVVRALSAMMSADVETLSLVFGGGTALGRAHGLLRRMSEDIDLRIVGDSSQSRGALGRLREAVTASLLDAGFQFDPENPHHRVSKYGSRYTLYRLPYAPIAKGEGVLRPEIKIETAAFPVRRPAVARTVTSFVAEAFGRPAELAEIACVSVVETAADKFVALTRRGGAELAGLQKARDPTLARHLYDLWMIRDHYDAESAASLAREVMQADAATYGDKFPAYRVDPIGETVRAVEGLSRDRNFSEDYKTLIRDLVYGDAPNFDAALAELQTFAERVCGK